MLKNKAKKPHEYTFNFILSFLSKIFISKQNITVWILMLLLLFKFYLK